MPDVARKSPPRPMYDPSYEGDLIGPALVEDRSPPAASKQASPTQGAVTRKSDGLASSWMNWLADPTNKSMLIQFGADMLQPPAPGQSGVGQIGAAVASAFETKDRQQVENQKVQQTRIENERAARAEARADRAERRATAEETSQADLRSAQAEYYRTGGKGRTTKTDTPAARYKAVLDNINTLNRLWTNASEAVEFGEDEDGSAAQMKRDAELGLSSLMQEAQTLRQQMTGGAGGPTLSPATVPLDPARIAAIKALPPETARAQAAAQIEKAPNTKASVLALLQAAGIDTTGL